MKYFKQLPTLLLLLNIGALLSILFSIPAVAEDNQSVKTKENTINVLFISAAHSNKAKVNLLKKIAEPNKAIAWNINHKTAKSIKADTDLVALFQANDIVILDAVSIREAQKTYQSYLPSIAQLKQKNSATKVISLNWLANIQAQYGLTQKTQKSVDDYWQNGGRKNFANMLNFIAYNVLTNNGLTNKKPADLVIEPAIIYPEKGIYHPSKPGITSKDLATYQQWLKPKADQVKIALLMQRSLIETEQTQVIDETIKRLEEKNVYVVPFFFNLSPSSGDYSELLQLPSKLNPTTNQIEKEQQTDIDLIINFRNIHWANKRKVEFKKFSVPVLQAMTYYGGDQKTWEEDKQGVSAGMMAFTLVLPESAGVVDPMIIAAMDSETQSPQVIDYQLNHLVNKAVNIAKLKYKPNQDKKLTVFVWGDKDVGASFMNIPSSIEAISNHLANDGYQTAERNSEYLTNNISKILDPFYRDFQLNELLDEDLAELMPIKPYLEWFNTLPKALTKKITDHWGQPKDNFMAVERNGEDFFILPRIRNGNMLIMRQPPRSDDKNDENMIYHQGLVPINHFYLAAYFYARKYWHSDAIIHLGTHGSQEYLGGKERGLSVYDQGNLAVWDTPVVYPFIVDDVGEAMQTKRRGSATVISHMTPPFAAAGLHGDISELHELMHQYKQLDQGGVKQKTAEQLVTLCFETNLCKDLNLTEVQIAKDYDSFIDVLHSHLESLATANQPLGLHTFGHLAEQDLVISTLVQMLGVDFTELASTFEHDNYALPVHDHDNENISEDETDIAHSHTHQQASNAVNSVNTDDVDDQLSLKNIAGYHTVLNYIVLNNKSNSKQPVEFSELNTKFKIQIERGRELYQNMTGIRELNSMTDFLSAKYIPVKTGGDPIRHPESLATGFNLYGFDPSKVPTKAAFEQGKALVEQMINDYQKKHGKFPDKMAFSLWSIETMRHYGVLEAQVMYAMGVKPKWSAGGRVIGTEVIEYSELKRPRVDVVLSATGLYRDAFPNVMQLLAKAVNQVAKLKEENNPIWKNSQRVKSELITQGVEEKEAEYLSTIRIFSNRSGDYGSGVDDAAWASDTWETDKKISDNYLSKMGYFFGADNSRWGEQAKNSQGETVGLYEAQLSGTDIATFARSSNLFGMLSSDDPFEYFGGLSLAVRNIDGKSPDMVIANLRDAKQAKAEDAALFMAKELRTRMFHPRWIKEMQKEGYSGAVSLASRMDNFFGWQVVDPSLVRNDQWDEYMDVYVDDKLDIQLDEWFEKINPAALARMMERMLEAERKDYWQADPERLKQLVERYIDMVNKHKLVMLNDALRENVEQLAEGFGLAPLVDAKTLSDMATFAEQQKQSNKEALEKAQEPQNKPVEEVEGQKLEKQAEQDETEPNNFIWQAFTFIFFIILFGVFYQWRAASRPVKLHHIKRK